MSPNKDNKPESKTERAGRKAEALQHQQALAAKRRAERQRLLFILGGVAIVGIVVLGIALFALPKPADGPAVASSDCAKDVKAVVSDPNQPPGDPVRPSAGSLHLAHINDTLPATYNSNPPSSGWHYYIWASPGPATNTVPDTMLVHNLEHGYVVIDYNYAPGQCPALSDKLAKIASSYDKVIVNPRPDANAPKIALTAWGRIEKLDGYDETEINRFIKYWMSKPGNAPEWGIPAP